MTIPIRDGLVSIDHAARDLGIQHQVLWRLLHSRKVRVHRVEWDGRKVSAVSFNDLVRVRRETQQLRASAQPVRTRTPAPTEPTAKSEPATPRTAEESSRWALLREEQARRTELEERVGALEGQLEQARERVDFSEEALRSARIELRQAQESLGGDPAATHQEHERAGAELERELELRNRELGDASRRLAEEREAFTSEREGLAAELERSETERLALRDALRERDEAIDGTARRLDALLGEAQVDRRTLTNELEMIRRLQRAQERTSEDLERRLAEARREIEDLRRRGG